MASIEELKRRVPMHDLAERLGLRRGKGGENALYHSPSSRDTNASLSIMDDHPDYGPGFKDWSSDTKGSCVDLVMLVQKCDVSEAMRYLHDAYGIPRDPPPQSNAERRPVSLVDTIASNCLKATSAPAVEYLTGRGISMEAITPALSAKTIGCNEYTSPKRSSGEVGFGGPAAAFLVYDRTNSNVVAVDMRYIDPASNGGVKTQSQGEKVGHYWTASPRRLASDDTKLVFIVESAINALSIDTCAIPYSASLAIRGTGNAENIDFRFLLGKQVVICMDNDKPREDGPLKGTRAGHVAACKLYDRLTSDGIAAILVDQSGWREDLGDGKNGFELINDVNDYLQARGVDSTRKALMTFEQWLIPGMPGDATRIGKPRVYLPDHDFAQYWRYRSRVDFSSFVAKKGEEDTPDTVIDLAGFRLASFSRISVASATATMTGEADHSPATFFAVTVQTPRHGARLTRSVLNDKQVHNLNMWNQFGPVWEPKRFSRMVTILERTANIGARTATNYVGLAWRNGKLIVNEGRDCYFTNPEQQCPYHDLTFPTGRVSDAALVLTKYQETFRSNAATIALAWALGGHLKAILGFWPHLVMQAGKSSGKSTLVKALERATGFTMFSGQSLQTEYRMLTSISHTSHPVGWEELSARDQKIIDKAVGLLQENYQYTITRRGAEMTEYVLSAPVLLAGEDVPVRSLHGKLIRTDLTGKKGPMLPRNLPSFPVRQWLDYLSNLKRDTVLAKFDELSAWCEIQSCADSGDEGGKRMASNYAALLLAWRYLCDFAGIEPTTGGFGNDLVGEMNRHTRETTAERSPWVWILETALSEIDAGTFRHPFKFDLVDGVECLLVRPSHIIDHISTSPSLREKWNALPIKTATVFRRALDDAKVIHGEKDVERTIFMKRVQHLTPLSLAALNQYGLSVAWRKDHVSEN